MGDVLRETEIESTAGEGRKFVRYRRSAFNWAKEHEREFSLGSSSSKWQLNMHMTNIKGERFSLSTPPRDSSITWVPSVQHLLPFNLYTHPAGQVHITPLTGHRLHRIQVTSPNTMLLLALHWKWHFERKPLKSGNCKETMSPLVTALKEEKQTPHSLSLRGG